MNNRLEKGKWERSERGEGRKRVERRSDRGAKRREEGRGRVERSGERGEERSIVEKITNTMRDEERDQTDN